MEAMALIPALLLNCIIAALELFVLTKIADKKDILKYRKSFLLLCLSF